MADVTPCRSGRTFSAPENSWWAVKRVGLIKDARARCAGRLESIVRAFQRNASPRWSADFG